MPRLEACLIDAYDTIVTCDFASLRLRVPALAGIPLAAWEQEYNLISPMLNAGRLSKVQAFRQIMANCGAQAPDDLIAEMIRLDQELLLANARLYDDVIPFLTRLSDRGIKIAIVSNCTENTRAMLVATGVADLADELVLSCEVGSMKPYPEIYTTALDELGVAAVDAVFIDDQPTYCVGAEALGIRSIQIARDRSEGYVSQWNFPVVHSLFDVLSLL